MKKTVLDKLLTKVDTIDASGSVLKTQCNTDKSGLEKKLMTLIRKYLKSEDLFKNIIMLRSLIGKIPSITGLATTPVENKIPNVSNLVNKTDNNAKILDIEAKYFTACGYNKFTGKIFNRKIKEKRFVDNSDISGFIENSDLHKKIAIQQNQN